METLSPLGQVGTHASRPRGWLVALGVAVVLGLMSVAWADGESGATFVAHEARGGLVVDHWAGGGPAELRPASWFHWFAGPTHVLRVGDTDRAALWLGQPGEAVVRSGATADAPVTGRVEPSWDDNAIRLTLWPAVGPPIRSDVFKRVDLGAGPDALSRSATDWEDVRGTYEAALRAPDGAQVGWLRAHVGLHQGGFVRYEGVFPSTIDESLATGAAAALGNEITWIAERATGVPKRWM